MLASMSEEDVHALRRIYSAMARWDLDELVADVAHDVELSLPDPVPWGGTHHGPEGIRAFATIFRDHIDGTWADPDDFLEADDRIVVLGRLRGQAKETGEEFEVGFAHIWALTDGVASRLRAFYDTAPILAALEGRPLPKSDAGI
jgi:ketosteroid isomerase-like protein